MINVSFQRKSKAGFALAAVVMAMVLIVLIVPVLYKMTERDTKWSVEQKHSSLAIEIATAGIDRALWKLKETNDNWYHILSTGPLSGYNNDIDYNDVSPDGIYRIRISSVTSDRMLIQVTAKDNDANVYRAVQAYATRTQVQAALHGYNLVNSTSAVGEFTVHWGPIYDTGNLVLNTVEINQLYPRKFVAGSIDIYLTTGSYTERDMSPDTPNTDNLEYWSYYNVPPIVTPDFDYYQAIAEDNGTYHSGNKTYKAADLNLLAADGVIYCEGKLILKNADKFFDGVIIAKGTLDLRGNNNGTSSPTANNYSVTPHSSAYLEYQRNTPINKNQTGADIEADTADEDQYPGDGGLNTSKAFTFGSTTGGASGKKPSIRGFVYVGTELKGNSKLQVIHGAMSIAKNVEIFGGVQVEVFYDPSVVGLGTEELRTASSEIYLEDWEEIEATAF